MKEKNDTGHRGEARRLRNVTNGAERTEKQSREKLKLGSLVTSILSVGVSNTKSFPKVPFKFPRVHFFQCFQFQPKITSRNSAYPKHVFTQHYEKYDQSLVLKTQRTGQTNNRMSLSTFQCMPLCSTTIYSHQNPSSQLQTI